MFSGLSDRRDSISNLVIAGGWAAHDVDIVNDPAGHKYSQDLGNEVSWAVFEKALKDGNINFVWLGTPCETWTLLRNTPPGPRPLRSINEPFGISYKDITPEEKEQLRLGTYFALKSIEIASLCVDLGIPFAIENPREWKPGASLFRLPTMVELLGRPGVKMVDFDQCMFGAESTKQWCTSGAIYLTSISAATTFRGGGMLPGRPTRKSGSGARTTPS